MPRSTWGHLPRKLPLASSFTSSILCISLLSLRPASEGKTPMCRTCRKRLGLGDKDEPYDDGISHDNAPMRPFAAISPNRGHGMWMMGRTMNGSGRPATIRFSNSPTNPEHSVTHAGSRFPSPNQHSGVAQVTLQNQAYKCQ